MTLGPFLVLGKRVLVMLIRVRVISITLPGHIILSIESSSLN